MSTNVHLVEVPLRRGLPIEFCKVFLDTGQRLNLYVEPQSITVEPTRPRQIIGMIMLGYTDQQIYSHHPRSDLRSPNHVTYQEFFDAVKIHVAAWFIHDNILHVQGYEGRNLMDIPSGERAFAVSQVLDNHTVDEIFFNIQIKKGTALNLDKFTFRPADDKYELQGFEDDSSWPHDVMLPEPRDVPEWFRKLCDLQGRELIPFENWVNKLPWKAKDRWWSFGMVDPW